MFHRIGNHVLKEATVKGKNMLPIGTTVKGKNMLPIGATVKGKNMLPIGATVKGRICSIYGACSFL